ncbi:MAG TPA: thiamine diphosphokinase [Bacillota bacterium]|nr:thiamine diphosphokinase [Bacillota bacterium]
MKKGLLVAGGPLSFNQLKTELAANPDLLVAADAGGKYLLEVGAVPDILIGDFDSLEAEALAQYSVSGTTLLRFPPQKDQTDLELALEYAIKNGVNSVRILGGLGRRIDHTLANIGLLQLAWESGVAACLVDETQELQLTGNCITVNARPDWAVSLIPLTPVVKGVTTAGLKYPLKNARLHSTATRGIHNEFAAGEAKITVLEGLLLVVLFRED